MKAQQELTQGKKVNMNDQSPVNQPLDRHEARRQRREARRAALGARSSGGTWVAGLILILLGTAFLMQNMGTFSIPFRNWWALFILMPAIGAFSRAFRVYKHADNRLTTQARNSLFVGLILTIVSGLFLFDLNWSLFGPLLIILVGLGILLNNMLPTME